MRIRIEDRVKEFIRDLPAGAVISEVNVTSSPFNKNRLPQAPQGATLGATCFRIAGLLAGLQP